MYRILLVSSDDAFRRMATRFVPRIDLNMDMHVANNPDAAIAVLKQNSLIEMVVLDHSDHCDVKEFLDMSDRSRFDLPLIVISAEPDPSLLDTLVNHHVDGFLKRGMRDATEFFTEFCQRVVITAERRRNENEHRNNERRMEAMIAMAKMDQSNFQSVVEYALEKCLEITDSEIGYVSSYDRDKDRLIMLTWSNQAMKSCEISNYPIEFDLKSTGIWGEPIRLGRTVTVNDYDSDVRAMKKGTPTGHVKLTRLLMVPLYIDGKIIGTAGVGNKASEYTWSDEKQLKMMMEDLFEIHHKIEMSKKQSFHIDIIRRFIDFGPMGLIFVDGDMDVIMINEIAKIIIGAGDMPEHFHLADVRTTQSEDIIKQINYVRKSGTPQRSRILMSDEKMDMMFEVFTQMSELSDSRMGFMVLFNDISDLTMMDSDYTRAEDHISVLEGPVLNALLKACSGLEPRMSSLGDFLKLQSAVRFMDDYRVTGKNRATWMRVESIVDKASRASALGGINLTVKAAGIEILADPAFPLVFKHLFNNSIAHGGDVRNIEVRCRITRGNMTIVYSDDGAGIPSDIRQRILDMTSDGKFGMFLIKSLVSSSGFSIACPKSDRGAVFEIDVPPQCYQLN